MTTGDQFVLLESQHALKRAWAIYSDVLVRTSDGCKGMWYSISHNAVDGVFMIGAIVSKCVICWTGFSFLDILRYCFLFRGCGSARQTTLSLYVFTRAWGLSVLSGYISYNESLEMSNLLTLWEATRCNIINILDLITKSRQIFFPPQI